MYQPLVDCRDIYAEAYTRAMTSPVYSFSTHYESSASLVTTPRTHQKLRCAYCGCDPKENPCVHCGAPIK